MVKLTFRKPRSLEEKFVWRRAFRAGSVRRGDLVSAFNCAETKATNTLKAVIDDSAGQLLKEGRYAVPAPWAQDKPPAWADENDLLWHLEHRLNEPTFEGAASQHTGLKPDELPVLMDPWFAPTCGSPGALWGICHAIRDSTAVWIEYTGMRKHETKKWRRILPLSLQRIAETWRVYSHDLESDTYPLRSFKLARISDYRIVDKDKPKRFTIANPMPAEVTYRVAWNPDLGSDQKAVLKTEFGVNDNAEIQISSAGFYEYALMFKGASTGEAAWPPFSNITRKYPR